MPRQDAANRARVGQVSATQVTIERPPTVVKGPDGTTFTLPRASAAVPLYHKINARVADPVTGKRLRRPRPVSRVSFGTFVLAAFAGWRVFQLLSRSMRKRRVQQQAEGQLVEWASDDEEVPQQLPPLRAIPAMLSRAMPRLGPPSRVKQISARRDRPRRTPNARQMMQTRGAAQRRPMTLERLDAAARQQERELGIVAGPNAALPAPAPLAALPAPPPPPPPPAAGEQRQRRTRPAAAAAAAAQQQHEGGQAAGAAEDAGSMRHAALRRPQRQQQRRAMAAAATQPEPIAGKA